MSDSLDENPTDYVVSAAKAVLGMVPFAGSLLAELAGTVIPQQRIDRLADFTRNLEQKLAGIDQESIRTKLSDENFTDLLEESARQAAQSVTQERREYLATMIAIGISQSQVTFIEARHLLRLLGQINDIEVIWLRSYAHPYMNGDEEFRAKHGAVLEPIPAFMSSDQATLDRSALQENYTQHLISLGLLVRPLQIDSKTGAPIYDKFKQNWKTQGTQVTPLGRLLLKHIGLSSPRD